jgi:hypothetical protein
MRFLTKYETEDDLSTFFDIKLDKTVGKWTKHYTTKIAKLLPNLTGTLEENDTGLVFLMTIDGTHCPVWEPCPFSKRNASHKFGMNPGFNYEIGLSLFEPKLIWVYGPTQPGKLTDLMVFQVELKQKLPTGKRILGDGIYKSEAEHISMKNDLGSKEVQQYKDRALARHESFNNWLKRCNILSHAYRHDRKLKNDPALPHGVAFRAVCVVVQTQINNGSTWLFDPYPIFGFVAEHEAEQRLNKAEQS